VIYETGVHDRNVHQVIPVTHCNAFEDVPNKKEVVGVMYVVRLDIVEAKILAGIEDLERAALVIEGWSCPETLITKAEGMGPV
jgi:hypothetical protein